MRGQPMLYLAWAAGYGHLFLRRYCPFVGVRSIAPLQMGGRKGP